MAGKVDLSRYSDLTQRLAVISSTGAPLRGDQEDLVIHDGEPALADDEKEIARFLSHSGLQGPRSVQASDKSTLGLIFEGSATIVVTSQRLIVMVTGGNSQLVPLENHLE